jgi:CelD/BcsL family acetyltransferase involved in cellulose biosynthesis
VKLTVHDQASIFEQLKSEWNALLERSNANQIFSTWEWQSTWWDVYQRGKQLWIVSCRDENDRLIGLGPWFIEQHPVLGRVVRSVGCVDVTDYLDLIVNHDYLEPVLNCFAVFLSGHQHEFDNIDLCNIPELSPTPRLFPGILEQYGFKASVKQQEVCPVIDLPASWDDYLEGLDKKYRHELRRKIRRSRGAGADWYVVDSTHNLDEEIERFLELMASSDKEKADFLKDEQNVTFFKKIAPVLFEKGWLQLSFLTVGGHAAATYLNFDYGGRILVYNSGLAPDYGHLSPGIVLLAHLIRTALDSRHSVFDFLRGNEVYKYHMGGKDTGVMMLTARFVGHPSDQVSRIN